MRIYLSGPITGVPGYKKRFKKLGARIAAAYPLDSIVNPGKLADVFPEGTHDEYMVICLQMLDMCDMVMMLPGWENSVGATEEHDFAVRAGKVVVYLHGI